MFSPFLKKGLRGVGSGLSSLGVDVASIMFSIILAEAFC